MKKHTSPALIFDFDGTIADTLDVLIDLYNERLVREFRCKRFDKSQKEFFRQIPAKEFLRSYGIRYYKLPFMAVRTRFLLKRYVEQVQPFPGMLEWIQHVAGRDVFLGIATSNSVKNVQRFLRKNQLTDSFQCIYGGRNLFGKHRTLQKLIREQRLSPENTIYIGDEVRDIEAARQVGFRVAAVSWGFQHLSLLQQHQPDFLIEKVEDLEQLIL